MRFNKYIILPVILLMAFTPAGKSLKTEHYYNLQSLKKSSAPRNLEMINHDNLSRKKSIISNGVLVTYKNREAGNVFISGNFNNWKPLRMTRSRNGVWFFFYDCMKSDNTRYSKEIRYKFNVDGIWTVDPKNYIRENDGAGSYVSLAKPAMERETTHLSYRIINRNLVEFRLYKPGARSISLVGDFNNWNPENDLLGKNRDGIWRLKKRIPAGKYRYKYIVDGEWVPDLYNRHSASDITGQICSILTVE